VPCTTPLNVSIAIESATVPLHPLDLTARISSDASGTTCQGLIQAVDASLLASNAGDFILGVPFMRNAYTVLAHAQPASDGTFPAVAAGTQIVPRLGLLPLTDPKTAMDEFTSVRVQNRPLSTNSTSSGDSSSSSSKKNSGGGGVPLGVKVFAGIAGFFVLCALLFAVRWLLARRRFRRNGGTETPDEYTDDGKKVAAYGLSRRASSGGYGAASLGYADATATNDAWGNDRGDKTKTLYTASTRGSVTTRVGSDDGSPRVGEFGVRASAGDVNAGSPDVADPWDPRTALSWSSGAGTLTHPTQHRRTSSGLPLLPDHPPSPELDVMGNSGLGHDRRPSDTPLLHQTESTVPATTTSSHVRAGAGTSLG
jgi:hypothetical protein